MLSSWIMIVENVLRKRVAQLEYHFVSRYIYIYTSLPVFHRLILFVGIYCIFILFSKVFQQIPGTLLVKASLQGKDGRSSGN